MKLIKVIILAILMILAMFILGALNVPYSTPGKRTICRHELSNICTILLAGDVVMGDSFMSWRDNDTNTSKRNIAEQAGRYCYEFSMRKGQKIFSFDNGTGCLVDPWGNPYNMDLFDKLCVLKSNPSIRQFAIDKYIIWSSGPNGINEGGEGDDIFELPRKLWGQNSAKMEYNE